MRAERNAARVREPSTCRTFASSRDISTRNVPPVVTGALTGSSAMRLVSITWPIAELSLSSSGADASTDAARAQASRQRSAQNDQRAM